MEKKNLPISKIAPYVDWNEAHRSLSCFLNIRSDDRDALDIIQVYE